jgi:2-polyprenyl-3-methyl-5-hydroxy-6-metoxy-1,4-benzoquinol methylase
MDVRAIIAKHAPARGAALDLGAGDGTLAQWLAEKGFSCVAVDVDAQVPAPGSKSIKFVREDVRKFALGLDAYDLIVACHVLQFLVRSEREQLLGRIVGALRPGGLLVIVSFTTSDPSYDVARRRGLPEIEPETFVDPGSRRTLSFFASGELAAWAAREGLEIVRLEESIVRDEHPPHGPHTHGVVSVACKKPA